MSLQNSVGYMGCHVNNIRTRVIQIRRGTPTPKVHSDFDRKLKIGNALQWILSNGSNIIAAPSGHQSLNGLAERTWRTIIQMA